MLYVPRSGSPLFQTVDNWGTNPSVTPGTSIVPGTSNAEGSWTQILSATSFPIYGFHLNINTGATNGAAKNHLMDIGVDPAGGTSYSAVISNIVCGLTSGLTGVGVREFYFPLFIPQGSTVAARVQGSEATAGTIRACIKAYGARGAPEAFRTGYFCETIGTVTNSGGTSFTPGNAADGSWTSLGTTSTALWWWQLSYQLSSAGTTAEYTYIDLAYGDASNKHLITRMMHTATTGEAIGIVLGSHMTFADAYKPVPAGATIYVRGRCNNAPDSGYNALAHGIGG